jgi:hypothetical protein
LNVIDWYSLNVIDWPIFMLFCSNQSAKTNFTVILLNNGRLL